MRIDKYLKEIKDGKILEPIEVFINTDGSKVIADGHHRYIASRIAGVEIKTSESNGLIVGMDWKNVEFKKLFLED